MRCPHCGAENQSSIMSFCEKCGGALEDNNSYEPVDFNSYLVPSILVLIFCCQIGGIVALVYSVMAQSSYDAGNYRDALTKADSAKGWCWASVVITIVLLILGALLGWLISAFSPNYYY